MALLISIVSVFSFAQPSLATNGGKQDVINASHHETVPLYLTISDLPLEELGEIRPEIEQHATNMREGFLAENVNVLTGAHTLEPVAKSEQAIVYSLSYDQIRECPALLLAYENSISCVSEGDELNYINFLLPKSSSKTLAAGDPDDPQYWYDNSTTLCYYAGYNIRYIESELNIDPKVIPSGEVVKSLSPQMTWGALLSSTLSFACDVLLPSGASEVVSTITGVSSIIGSVATVPSQTTLSQASGIQIYYTMGGTYYVRTILIEDKNDRIPGYAFYSWGTTERANIIVNFSGKKPKVQNSSGTWEYEPYTAQPVQKNILTPNHGSTSVTYLSELIRLYENESGYFTYNEQLDLNSGIIGILSSLK